MRDIRITGWTGLKDRKKRVKPAGRRAGQLAAVLMAVSLLVPAAGPGAAAAAQAATAQEAAETVSDDRSIVVHLAGRPGDPDPARVMDADTASLLKQVSEGLTVLDENGEPAPGSAASWEVSEDGLVWTFYLRDDLRWSDGAPMEAADFAAIFRQTADPVAEVLYGRHLTGNIAGYEALLEGEEDALELETPDAGTLVVRLSSPDPDFAEKCASWALLPTRDQIQEYTHTEEAEPESETAQELSDEEKQAENGPDFLGEDPAGNGSDSLGENPAGNGSDSLGENPAVNGSDSLAENSAVNGSDSLGEKPAVNGSALTWEGLVGNGPYVISSCREGESFLLEKNPFYHAGGRKPFDQVLWKISGDADEEYSDFLNGGVDALSEIPAVEEAALVAEALSEPAPGPSCYVQTVVADTLGLFFNCREEGLEDPLVRRALSAAPDRSFIASEILGNVYAPAADRKLELPEPPARALEGDQAEAKRLLAEAGYPGGKDFPELTCLASKEDASWLIAEYLADVWGDLGLRIRIETEEAEDVAQEKAVGTFDILCGTLSLASDVPSAELEAFVSDGEENVCGFSSDSYDRLLQAPAAEDGAEAEGAEAYESRRQRAMKMLEEELPCAPLAMRRRSLIRNGACTGIFCDASGCWQVWRGDAESQFVFDQRESGYPFPFAEADQAVNSMTSEGEIGSADSSADLTAPEDKINIAGFPAPGWETGAANLMASEGKTRAEAPAAPGFAALGQDRNPDIPDQGSGSLNIPVAGVAALGQDLSPDIPAQGSGSPDIPDQGSGSRENREEEGRAPGFLRRIFGDESRRTPAGFLAGLLSSEEYFEKADTEAWLTRQAWVLDTAREDADRLVSLPRYAQVHLTGTGNARYARIDMDGTFRYLPADRVTTEEAVLQQLRDQDAERDLLARMLTASVYTVKQSELADRAADARAETERILAEIAHHEMVRTQTRNPDWDGPVLSRSKGSVTGPSGKETYYNLNMNGVVNIMRRMGNTDEYWVRDDGCKMLGDYIMCAANLGVHPRGSLVESSLGTCIVCDTGGFASHNANQLDIAVTW